MEETVATVEFETGQRAPLDLTDFTGTCAALNLRPDQARCLALESCDPKLTEIPLQTLQFVGLRSLRLGNNSLADISPQIFALDRLEELDIGYNRRLTVIDESVANLTHLRVLIACGNALTALPASLGRLQKLSHINVSFNRLGNLPDLFANLPSLAILQANGNQLQTVNDAVWQCSKLRVLTLGTNLLTELSSKISNLQVLELLNVEKNRLTQLPCELEQVHTLETVAANENKISDFSALAKAARLRSLNIGKNDIGSVGGAMIDGWSSLCEDLCLNHNNLTTLPSSIAVLTNLKGLVCSNNAIATLPAEVAAMVALERLILDSNELTELPAVVGLLRSLTILNVAHNKITLLPTEVGQLEKLEDLDLSFNHLPSLPDIFASLASLSNLDVSGNKLDGPVHSFVPSSLRAVVESGRCVVQLHANPFINSQVPADVDSSDTAAVVGHLMRR